MRDKQPKPDPFQQAEVPAGMQPVVEMRELRNEPFFEWPELPMTHYTQRLSYVWFAFFLLSLAIAAETYGDIGGIVAVGATLLAANVGAVGALLAFVVRLRIGWGYVSSRLLDTETYYEEMTARDGRRANVATKDRETRTRDRLLDEYEVRPVLRRVDMTAAALLGTLVVSAGLLSQLATDPSSHTVDEGYLSTLKGNDAVAASDQLRAQQRRIGDIEGTPLDCDSRWDAGGAGCD